MDAARERRDGFVRSLPPNDWTLTEKIKTLRALHGWTQSQLASEAANYLPAGMRLSRRGISGLESGNDPEFSWPNGTYMHPLHIVAIATALKVPPSYLDNTIGNYEDVAQLRRLMDSIDLTVEDGTVVTLDPRSHSSWSVALEALVMS